MPVNKVNRKEYFQKWYAENKALCYSINRKWALAHPAKMERYRRKWALKNRELVNLKNREHRIQNKEALNAKARARYRNNLEYYREVARRAAANYRKRHPDRVALAVAKCKAARRATDPVYRALHNFRSRFHKTLWPNKKTAPSRTVVGCSWDDFRIYIESKFEPGMTWENYGNGEGKWSFDHIMPCAIFDMSNPEHQRRCFHFSNIQPLWSIDNSKKGAKAHKRQFTLPI